MKRNFIFTFVFFSAFNFLFSEGNPTYLFLRSDISARATAMGGSFVSMKGDPNGMFYNPAALSTIANRTVSVGLGNAFLDATYGHISANYLVENIGNIGFGLQYQSYGDFEEIDANENILGNFSVSDLALSIGVAKYFTENISLGITSKFITSNIAQYQSNAIAFDGGVLYYIPGPNQLTFGLSFLHFGTQLKNYSNTKEPLPFDLKAGMTIKPEHLPLELNINFHRLNVEQNNILERLKYFSIGGEFTLSKSLRFRFGYNNEKRKGLKLGTKSGMGGFSFGGGVSVKEFLIDYSFPRWAQLVR